jgi:hypothetical protein
MSAYSPGFKVSDISPGMEALLRTLPERPQPLAVRYAATSLLVGLCFLTLMGCRAAAVSSPSTSCSRRFLRRQYLRNRSAQ